MFGTNVFPKKFIKNMRLCLDPWPWKKRHKRDFITLCRPLKTIFQNLVMLQCLPKLTAYVSRRSRADFGPMLSQHSLCQNPSFSEEDFPPPASQNPSTKFGEIYFTKFFPLTLMNQLPPIHLPTKRYR